MSAYLHSQNLRLEQVKRLSIYPYKALALLTERDRHRGALAAKDLDSLLGSSSHFVICFLFGVLFDGEPIRKTRGPPWPID